MAVKLAETYEVVGSDFNDFRKALVELTGSTNLTPYEPNEICLMSYDGEDAEAIYLLCHMRDGTMRRRRLKKDDLERKAVPEEILKEFKDGNRLMLLLDKCITSFTSMNFVATLASRIGLAGQSLFTPTVKRDAYMAELLNNTTAPINVVTRKVNGVIKAFAAHSQGYPYIPQTILLEIIDKIKSDGSMGEIAVRSWRINHSITSVYIEFPEYADDVSATYHLPDIVIPGMILFTSDIGDASVSCIGTWKIKGCRVSQSSYKRRHRGDVDSAEIVKAIDKDVFSLYRKVPQRLCDLLSIDIADPESAIVMALSKKGIDLSGTIGKKPASQLEEALIAEIDSSVTYTAYDIVNSIMSVPERVSGLSETNVDKLSALVLKAAFLDWEHFKGSSRVVLAS